MVAPAHVGPAFTVPARGSGGRRGDDVPDRPLVRRLAGATAMTPARSQATMLGATALRMALSVAMTILLGRGLTAGQFGFFALVATAFGLAHELTDMGTGNVAVRVAARARSSERAMLETLLGLRLVLSLVAAGACAALAAAQPAGWQCWLLLGTALVLGFAYVSAFSLVFQLRQAQAAPALLSIAVQLGAVAGAAAFLACGVPGDMFAIVLLLREAAVVVGTRLLAVRLLGYRPGPRFRRAAMRPFLGQAVVVAIATLCYHVQFQGGPFFVQFLRPAEELGAFAAALRPLVPVLFLPWVLMLPLVPVLSWLAHDPALASADRSRLAFRAQARGALGLCIGLGAVGAAACAALAPAGLEFLYGPRFAEGPLSAVATLRWLAVPLGCSFPLAAISTVLLADDREWTLLRISVAGLLVYLVANLWLLPRYGFVGSAMATTAAIGALTLAAFWLVARTVGPGAEPAGEPGRGMGNGWLALMILPGAVLGLALSAIEAPPVWRLAGGGMLAALAAAAVWWFPGLAACRAEQAAMSRRLLAHG